MSSANRSALPPARVPPHIRLNSGQEDLAATELNDVPESSDQLLPPSRSGYNSRSRSTSPRGLSQHSSRRSSFDSDRSRDSRGYDNPFRDTSTSRPGSRASSDDYDVNTQTVSEKYNILPSAGLLLFPEDVEKDDYLHNPDPGGEPRDCDVLNRRGFINLGGLALLTIGILKYTITPDPCRGNPLCLDNGKVPLLKNVRTSLIDPDTPSSAKTKTDFHGNTWNLVFSDEFSTPGRTFYDGDDPYWEAMDIWYGVTKDLEWYDPDAATTNDGVLELRFDAFQNHELNYRSGMLQSWNKMCFKQGRLEASISLPGRGDTVGFWPGFWAMGNLGRPGYASTTDGLWPYSYDNVCDAGITPNQSTPDGISYLPGLRLPSCTCDGEDHPSQGKSRSAPEIDVLEASVAHLDELGNQIGVVSQSFQVAPFDIWYQPNYDFVELYDPSITTMNSYKGGPYQQAFSALTNLNNDWYDGNGYQVYAFEYTPGDNGDIVWYVGDDPVWRLHANSLSANGNVGRRTIPEEPMTVIANFGISPGFSALNFTGLAELMPAIMRIDYIRIYQDGNGEVTCDPDGYETTQYIHNHPKAYRNPNVTSWADAGYEWPKNKLMTGC
ncbi:hypothetical protein DV738_g4668, partial [Chaetothyriales sp. CBS 135597]